ncbi:hypothetical protein [uncultured Hymenobacter sp.]|uniref:hypothetical protein n=1 Tax=uncultured Hymenobacter sp. TaxID=170016 RepID=UPI0035CC986C
MDYEPTEAELNGLSGDETAADQAAAAWYEQQEAARAEWERQAHYHHEQEQAVWEEGEYEQMIAEVEGY